MPATRPLVVDELVHGEALAQLGPSLDRRIDEDAVERRSPRPESHRDPVHDEIAADEREVTGIRRDRGDRRAPGREHAVEQPPLVQAARPVHGG